MKELRAMTGVILSIGNLRIDGSLDLAPGRVKVIVTECPPDADETSPWSRLERAWGEQRSRYYRTTEAAILAANSEPITQGSTAADKLSLAAADLRDSMSQLSEDCYCAGWLGDLEYLLWSAVMNGPVQKGNWDITQSDIERLRLLARRCGGWIAYDDARKTKVWLPIEEWLPKYDHHLAKQA